MARATENNSLLPSCCPICTEPFHNQQHSFCFPPFSQENQRHEVKQTCCQQSTCHICLHSHIRSVMDEGLTGDGRKQFTCPLGCGHPLQDDEIRLSIWSVHGSWIKVITGWLLYAFTMVLTFLYGGLTLSFCQTKKKRRRYNEEDAPRKRYRWTKTRQERRELELYERWSLTTALATLHSPSDDKETNSGQGDAAQHYVHVIRCPGRDCDCLWLAHRTFWSQKQKHEKEKGDGSSSNTPSSILKSLFSTYKPIKPQLEEQMMEQNGYTTDHWLHADAIDPFRLRQNQNQNESNAMDDAAHHKDGRMTTCPQCGHTFCGLCTRPWTNLARSSGRLLHHTSLSCTTYARKTVSRDDDGLALAAADAKCCPGCRVRTSRIDGCNHMTCRCGKEWCYVCELAWHSGHYSCREGQVDGVARVGSALVENCVIS